MHHKTKEEKQFPLVPPPPRFADMSEPLQQDYDPSKDKHLAQFWYELRLMQGLRLGARRVWRGDALRFRLLLLF